MIPSGAKVYVVDDDASFVRSTVRLLQSWSIAAEGFTSPRAFLALDPGNAPACVLLDYRIPEMSGLEVQRALMANGRKLPIVFVSGHADLKAGVDALKAGAVDFLPKPVDEGPLLGAIERALAADVVAEVARASARHTRDALERLSPSERVVCRYIATGLRDDQIADALRMTEAAVRAARLHAMDALKVTSLVNLARTLEAAEHG